MCRTARTRAAYADLRQTYSTLPVSRAERQRQALVFYYMHNLYGAGDPSVLREAFVHFWKTSNVGVVTELELMQAFLALAQLPAFDRFVAALVRGRGAHGLFP